MRPPPRCGALGGDQSAGTSAGPLRRERALFRDYGATIEPRQQNHCDAASTLAPMAIQHGAADSPSRDRPACLGGQWENVGDPGTADEHFTASW